MQTSYNLLSFSSHSQLARLPLSGPEPRTRKPGEPAAGNWNHMEDSARRCPHLLQPVRRGPEVTTAVETLTSERPRRGCACKEPPVPVSQEPPTQARAASSDAREQRFPHQRAAAAGGRKKHPDFQAPGHPALPPLPPPTPQPRSPHRRGHQGCLTGLLPPHALSSSWLSVFSANAGSCHIMYFTVCLLYTLRETASFCFIH